MKLIFTYSFAFLFSFFSIAQITINPEVVLFETSGEDIEVKPTVTNNTGEQKYIYWMFEKGENFPSDWSVIVCDDTLCYAPNIFKSSELFPNIMEENASFEFKFTVNTGGVDGDTYAIIHLYDDAECTNEVATSMMPPTSVNTEFLDKVSIYPNPVEDQFSIKEDQEVRSIDIFNVGGQMVYSKPHLTGQNHSIFDLPSGGYIVVLRDASDNILRSLQLRKQ